MMDVKIVVLIILSFLFAAGNPTRNRGHAGARSFGRSQGECPPSRMRCFANPCEIGGCPAFPNARCVNDDPCEPFCIGHFYDEDRLLTPYECRRNRRGNQ